MFKHFFDTWNYLGFRPEQIHRNLNKIYAVNLAMMQNLGLLAAALLLPCALYPLLYLHSIPGTLLYLCGALLALLFHFTARALQKRTLAASRHCYRVALLLFIHTFAGFGIYVSAIANPDMVATLFFICIICLQFAFLLSPLTINLSILLDCVVFILACYVMKPWRWFLIDMINCVTAFILSYVIGRMIARLRIRQMIVEDELSAANDYLYRLSIIDPLTGLYNRRKFLERAAGRILSHAPHETYVATILCDIDFFKQYNDLFGHDQGDVALHMVAQRLLLFRKTYDLLLCRWGGEEFMALFLTDSPARAVRIAEEMCVAVQELRLESATPVVSPYLTMSLGLYLCPCDATSDWNDLYRRADEALYAAKGHGRNRVYAMMEDAYAIPSGIRTP